MSVVAEPKLVVGRACSTRASATGVKTTGPLGAMAVADEVVVGCGVLVAV